MISCLSDLQLRPRLWLNHQNLLHLLIKIFYAFSLLNLRYLRILIILGIKLSHQSLLSINVHVKVVTWWVFYFQNFIPSLNGCFFIINLHRLVCKEGSLKASWSLINVSATGWATRIWIVRGFSFYDINGRSHLWILVFKKILIYDLIEWSLFLKSFLPVLSFQNFFSKLFIIFQASLINNYLFLKMTRGIGHGAFVSKYNTLPLLYSSFKWANVLRFIERSIIPPNHLINMKFKPEESWYHIPVESSQNMSFVKFLYIILYITLSKLIKWWKYSHSVFEVDNERQGCYEQRQKYCNVTKNFKPQDLFDCTLE